MTENSLRERSFDFEAVIAHWQVGAVGGELNNPGCRVQQRRVHRELLQVFGELVGQFQQGQPLVFSYMHSLEQVSPSWTKRHVHLVGVARTRARAAVSILIEYELAAVTPSPD